MIHYLRDNKGKTIVDVEVIFTNTTKDLKSSVMLDIYSELLMNNLKNSGNIIRDFNEISELRGWFHERYLAITKNANSKDCNIQVQEYLKGIADKYNLKYITD